MAFALPAPTLAVEPPPAPTAVETGSSTAAPTFNAPELKTARRSAFGPQAGTAVAGKPVEEAVSSSWTTTYLFAAAAAIAIIATAAAVAGFSRSTGTNGETHRVFTLRAKLVGGFGVVVSSILALATFSSRAETTVGNASATAMHINEQQALVLGADGDLGSVRLDVKNFLISNSDDALGKYSNDAATLAGKLDLVKKTIRKPERVKMVETYSDKVNDYFTTFGKVVALIDERNGIIESQMFPAANTATQLMEQVAQTAAEGGDPETAIRMLTINDSFQQARLSFFKYLRSADTAMAADATKRAEEVTRQVAQVQQGGKNAKYAAQLNGATGAVNFWVKQMEACAEVPARARRVRQERPRQDRASGRRRERRADRLADRDA
ncbi:MAG: hypothetical protein QM783_04765 [Phycisphaerales bacterium]